MGVHIKSEDLQQLQGDLERAPEQLMKDVRAATSKGALNIKADWRARWEGARSLPHLSSTVNYDVDVDGFTASAEIGVAKERKQGPLATFLEFGSVNNAPKPAGLPALQAETPRYEKALADIGEHFLDRR